MSRTYAGHGEAGATVPELAQPDDAAHVVAAAAWVQGAHPVVVGEERLLSHPRLSCTGRRLEIQISNSKKKQKKTKKTKKKTGQSPFTMKPHSHKAGSASCVVSTGPVQTNSVLAIRSCPMCSAQGRKFDHMDTRRCPGWFQSLGVGHDDSQAAVICTFFHSKRGNAPDQGVVSFQLQNIHVLTCFALRQLLGRKCSFPKKTQFCETMDQIQIVLCVVCSVI